MSNNVAMSQYSIALIASVNNGSGQLTITTLVLDRHNQCNRALLHHSIAKDLFWDKHQYLKRPGQLILWPRCKEKLISKTLKCNHSASPSATHNACPCPIKRSLIEFKFICFKNILMSWLHQPSVLQTSSAFVEFNTDKWTPSPYLMVCTSLFAAL